jgi:hypothetical protein
MAFYQFKGAGEGKIFSALTKDPTGGKLPKNIKWMYVAKVSDSSVDEGVRTYLDEFRYSIRLVPAEAVI